MEDSSKQGGGISLSLLSEHRTALMGAAMIFVVLFHVGMSPHNVFFPLRRLGNVGVDIFLFLSGIGLWFAWQKKPALGYFYRRRFVRLYPAWLIMAMLFYIPNHLHSAGGGYSPDLPNLVFNILVGWSFWRIDDLTFWFIPAIMLLYVIAPFYIRAIRRSPSWRWLPVAAIVWAVMVNCYPPVKSLVGHVEIFWSRVPIFLLGINCGTFVQRKHRLDASAPWLLLMLFVLSLAVCLELEGSSRGKFPLFIERMVYIPLSVSLTILLTWAMSAAPRRLLRGLQFVGTLSLEFYLIHLHFVLVNVQKYGLGYLLTALITFVVSLVLAFLLHHAIAFITKNW
ncbi:MAG: acyltransferase [Prevotella sp.]|uniref:acyltransferase n=1 Tax=Prevotella sp. TaxID=59823 RepID=UPI002A2DBDD4|nr:acyltransferase [Prevotella sp.]MDD7317737.1 acyltransferase [Prevotellaceae bacterium]MDY4020652.1 acyltransferase [Prevotella sp.]